MAALSPETREYFGEVVLNDHAERLDLLFSLELLLDEDVGPTRFFAASVSAANASLTRISRECQDPFMRKLVLFGIRQHVLAAEVRELDRRRH